MRTSAQVLTLKTRLLQATRAVHRHLLPAANNAKPQPAWACRTNRLVRTEELASNTDPESVNKIVIFTYITAFRRTSHRGPSERSASYSRVGCNHPGTSLLVLLPKAFPHRELSLPL